jgi:hypothetical protein
LIRTARESFLKIRAIRNPIRNRTRSSFRKGAGKPVPLLFTMEILEILKRAKSGGEIVPPWVSQSDIETEVHRRTAKAGYTNKYGELTRRTKIMSNGVGESKLNVWPRDEQGNLIGD